MKCIILAAGEGIRMRPLTIDTPKPMLPLLGKPLLEHIIEALPEEIDEIIMVVGYLHKQIQDYFGDSFGPRYAEGSGEARRFKIDYVIQKEKTGTYDALELCSNLLKDNERFLLLYADDIHGRGGLEKCTRSENLCLLVAESDNPKKFGVVEIDKEGIIKGVEEKPENPKSNLVSTGVLLLDKNIFKYPARKHPNGEHYLTDSIEQMIEDGHKFSAVKSELWLPIGYPEDLKRAEEILRKL